MLSQVKNGRGFYKSIIKPYWQILEDSFRNFPEISVFRGVAQTDFWKTHPVFFRNFNFRSMSLPDFWKIHPSFFVVFSFVEYRGMS